MKNETLQHPKYVQKAASEKVPVVRRPDWKVLLAYLRGQIPLSQVKSIDKTARLEMPTHVKRTAEDKVDSGPAAKKARLDNQRASEQEIKERLAAKLDSKQDPKLSINKASIDLSKELNRDKIAEIRAKFISSRRTRIKQDDEDDKSANLSSMLESGMAFSREKNWRTRTTILQSTGKTFSKTITAILTSVKAREEGKVVKPPQPTPRPGGGAPPAIIPPQPQPRQLPNYNRYDQEQFHGKNHTHGFNIETTGTFSGKKWPQRPASMIK